MKYIRVTGLTAINRKAEEGWIVVNAWPAFLTMKIVALMEKPRDPVVRTTAI